MMWDELLEEYFFRKSLRPDTEWSYNKVVNVFRSFVGRSLLPEEVTARQVLCWRRHNLNVQQLSPNTWDNKVRHMSALYRLGMETGLLHCDENPFRGVIVKKAGKRKKTLSQSQMVAVYLTMDKIEEDIRLGGLRNSNCALLPIWYWRIVLDILRYTGLRLNQLLHLRLKDINLNDEVITLCREGSKTYREWTVPAVRQVRGGLVRLLAEVQARGAKPSDPLFHFERIVSTQPDMDVFGVPSLQPVRSFFRRLSKECGFAVSPHRFRHTLATILMNSPDRNLPLVKGLLGHSSVTTTMEYIDINMGGAAKTLEAELSLYTDSYRKEPVTGDQYTDGGQISYYRT
jgi:integrase